MIFTIDFISVQIYPKYIQNLQIFMENNYNQFIIQLQNISFFSNSSKQSIQFIQNSPQQTTFKKLKKIFKSKLIFTCRKQIVNYLSQCFQTQNIQKIKQQQFRDILAKILQKLLLKDSFLFDCQYIVDKLQISKLRRFMQLIDEINLQLMIRLGLLIILYDKKNEEIFKIKEIMKERISSQINEFECGEFKRKHLKCIFLYFQKNLNYQVIRQILLPLLKIRFQDYKIFCKYLRIKLQKKSPKLNPIKQKQKFISSFVIEQDQTQFHFQKKLKDHQFLQYLYILCQRCQKHCDIYSKLLDPLFFYTLSKITLNQSIPYPENIYQKYVQKLTQQVIAQLLKVYNNILIFDEGLYWRICKKMQNIIKSEEILKFVEQRQFNSQHVFQLFFRFIKIYVKIDNKYSFYSRLIFSNWKNKNNQYNFLQRFIYNPTIFYFIQKSKKIKQISCCKQIWEYKQFINLLLQNINKINTMKLLRFGILRYQYEIQSSLIHIENKGVLYDMVLKKFIRMKIVRIDENIRILRILYLNQKQIFMRTIEQYFEENKQNIDWNQDIVYKKITELQTNNIDIKSQIKKAKLYKIYIPYTIYRERKKKVVELLEWIKQNIQRKQQFLQSVINYVLIQLQKLKLKQYTCLGCHKNKKPLLQNILYIIVSTIKTNNSYSPTLSKIITSFRNTLKQSPQFSQFQTQINLNIQMSAHLNQLLNQQITLDKFISNIYSWKISSQQIHHHKYSQIISIIFFQIINNLKIYQQKYLLKLINIINFLIQSQIIRNQHIQILTQIILNNISSQINIYYFCIQIIKANINKFKLFPKFCQNISKNKRIIKKHPQIVYQLYHKILHQLIINQKKKNLNKEKIRVILQQNQDELEIFKEYNININNYKKNRIIQFLFYIQNQQQIQAIIKQLKINEVSRAQLNCFIFGQLFNTAMLQKKMKILVEKIKLINILYNQSLDLAYQILNRWYQRQVHIYYQKNFPYIKNIALFIGYMTIYLNRPIHCAQLNIIKILNESKDDKIKLLKNVIIVTKLLNSVEHNSIIFNPRNPWIASILKQLSIIKNISNNIIIRNTIMLFFDRIQYKEQERCMKQRQLNKKFELIMSKQEKSYLNKYDERIKVELERLMKLQLRKLGDIINYQCYNLLYKLKINVIYKDQHIITDQNHLISALDNMLTSIVFPIINALNSQLYPYKMANIILNSIQNTFNKQFIHQKSPNLKNILYNIIIFNLKSHYHIILSQIYSNLLKVSPIYNKQPSINISEPISNLKSIDIPSYNHIQININQIYKFDDNNMYKLNGNRDLIKKYISQNEDPKNSIGQINKFIINYSDIAEYIYTSIINKNKIGFCNIIYYSQIMQYLKQHIVLQNSYDNFCKNLKYYERIFEQLIRRWISIGNLKQYGGIKYICDSFSQYSQRGGGIDEQKLMLLELNRMVKNMILYVKQRNKLIEWENLSELLLKIKQKFSVQLIKNEFQNMLHLQYDNAKVKQYYQKCFLIFFIKYIQYNQLQADLKLQSQIYTIIIHLLFTFHPLKYPTFIFSYIQILSHPYIILKINHSQVQSLYFQLLKKLFQFIQINPNQLTYYFHPVLDLMHSIIKINFTFLTQNIVGFLCLCPLGNQLFTQIRCIVLKQLQQKYKFFQVNLINQQTFQRQFNHRFETKVKVDVLESEIENFTRMQQFLMDDKLIQVCLMMISVICKDCDSWKKQDQLGNIICVLLKDERSKYLRLLINFLFGADRISEFVLRMIINIFRYNRMNNEIKKDLMKELKDYSKYEMWGSRLINKILSKSDCQNMNIKLQP